MIYQKILIINMLHIGDLLLATPVLRTMRANYPEAHIALLADAKIDDLVKYNPHIDELISVDKKGYHNKLGNYLNLIADIRKRKFDLVINLHPNERASAIAAFSGGGEIVGYASKGFGVFFDRLIKNKNFDAKVKNRPDVPHQAEEHLAMLKEVLGISLMDGQRLEMWVDQATQDKADQLWDEMFGKQPAFPVIGFNTGASWPTKRWTMTGFAAVADRLLDAGYGVAFFGGPMDKDNVGDILERMDHKQHPRIGVFTGRINWLELGALATKCAVFLTNDSGPMHVAVARQVPVVAIFGPSNDVGFGPYDSHAVTLKTELECRPCGNHQCDHHSCMRDITAVDVFQEVVKLAEQKSGVKRKPAVFFDRDGVLNTDEGYVYCKEDFHWNDGAIAAIKLLNDNDYYVFVVTNQSGVARGYYREEDVQRLHGWINAELAKEGAHVDAFYYCPHHPEKGNPPYKRACQCRKPKPGLLLQALAEWTVKQQGSLLIGDKASDMEAAAAANIQGFLFTGGNLLEFVKENVAI